MCIRAASTWLAGTGDVDLSAAEAARTHPGIESASCSQSPNGMFPNAAGALAPILLDVDFAHLGNSQHQAASKAAQAFEEVRRGAVPGPAAVRERVEATGPGPAGFAGTGTLALIPMLPI
jgi:hypothetical protein